MTTNNIGELKDIYEIARYVGISGSQINRFIETAAMCGYVLVRATADKTDSPSAAVGQQSTKEKS